MSNIFKRILLVMVLSLILMPVVSFQQILSLESEAVDSVSVDKADGVVSSGTSSNLEADTKMPEGEEDRLSSNEIMQERQLYPKKDIQDEKIAYLTFDDGPSPLVTPKILEILKQHDIKATFFVIGNMAERNPELVRQMQEEGHLICNHTYSHNYKLLYSSPDSFMADVTKCEDVLKSILGEDFETNILRFPSGSFGKKRLPFRECVKEHGYINVDWNALNGDAEGLHIPAAALINRIKETTENKNSAVVLMHDSNTKDTTAEALSETIEYLKSKGYAFKTLENYELQNSEVR